MKYRKLMALTTVVTLSLPFIATAEEKGIKLEEVVVTATKTERKVEEVPASVTIITSEEIKQQNVRDLSDVLKEAAGVDVVRMGSKGVATVDLRGMTFMHTSILIDGQPANSIMTGWGGRDAIQLPEPENVERVEIVRGPGSALYGPSTTGGVINIITKKGPLEKNQTRFFAGYDDLPTWSGGAATGGTLDRFTYSLNFKYQDSDGYKAAPDPALYPGYTGTMIHSLESEDWTRKTIGGRLGYMISDRTDIALMFNYLDEVSNTFGRPNTEMDIKKGTYGVEYKNSLTDNDILSINLSYSDHHANWDWDSYWYDTTPGWSNLDMKKTSTSDEKAKKYTAEIKNQWDITPSNSLLIGASYNRDEIDIQSYTLPNTTPDSDRSGDVKNLGLYLQDEIRLFKKKLFLTLGARYDTFDYSLQYDDTTTSPKTHKDISPTFSTFNPRGAVKFNFTESTGLRASVGTGFRPPDTYGLVGGGVSTYWESRANPDMDSEETISYDLGIDQKFPFGLKASITGYYIEVKDYIQTAMWDEGGVSIFQSKNIGKVEAKGVELEAEQEITKELSGFVNYTYNETKAASDLPAGVMGLPEDGKILALKPLHKANVGLVYNIPDRLKFRVDGRYVSEQYMYGDTKNESKFKLDSYFVANTKLTYFMPVGGNKVDMSVGVNNIFDEKYETRFKDYFEEPRVVFAEVGYQF